MFKNLLVRVLLIIQLIGSIAVESSSQCGAGYTQSQLNWDYLDYLVTSGNYNGYVTTTMANTQHFIMGTTRVTIAASGTSFTLAGENATHTGELSGYTGQDVEFEPTANGDSIVITFSQPVMNASFTLYDVDRSAILSVSARNASGTALNPGITLQAGTGLTVGGTATVPTITATNTNQNTSSNAGSATISVTGPVSVIKVIVTARGSNEVFWLSDINACVTGSYPSNWRNVSRPFTGMPSYILAVVDNNVMMLNPANGVAKPLFTDPGWTNLNGMAYDAVNRILYYTYSLTSSSLTNKTIWKYNVNTETIGSFVSNVTTTLGIPTYDQGVESGSASFYNGYYFFGVESSNSSRNSDRENTVWRIELDASQNAVRASQLYATRSDSNSVLIHDWSDIGVTNGTLYDFDGAASETMFYHYNMMTGQRTQYTPGTGINHPRQVAIDWSENVYNQGNSTSTSPSTGFIAPYNYNGTCNAAQSYTVSLNGANPSGSYGDCSEAFRPLCDFGDAPASYDPDTWSPAVNEKDTAIRIGGTFDREWLKTSSVLADADGGDEDGLPYVPIFSPASSNYLAQVPVYNNTGQNATVIAWLDFNNNGVFDASEICQALPPVPSSSSVQNVYLWWPSITTTLTNGSFTYLRIRITKTANGMGASNATGYYPDGETEDYRVTVDNYPLRVSLLNFNAKATTTSEVKLDFSIQEEGIPMTYEIQRSKDAADWYSVSFIHGLSKSGINNYTYTDVQPFKGTSYYRLNWDDGTGTKKYSPTRSVRLNDLSDRVSIAPNPASTIANIHLFNTATQTVADIRIIGLLGNILHSQTNVIHAGANTVELPMKSHWADGIYTVQIVINGKTVSKKLLVRK